MRNGSLWSNVVFEKETSSNSFIIHLNAHKVLQHKHVFFHCSLATLMTNWAQMSTVLLCYAYVGRHQVRILVFDNYQTCPVPLNGLWCLWGCTPNFAFISATTWVIPNIELCVEKFIPHTDRVCVTHCQQLCHLMLKIKNHVLREVILFRTQQM